jgi:hypothetical protein
MSLQHLSPADEDDDESESDEPEPDPEEEDESLFDPLLLPEPELLEEELTSLGLFFKIFFVESGFDCAFVDGFLSVVIVLVVDFGLTIGLFS